MTSVSVSQSSSSMSQTSTSMFPMTDLSDQSHPSSKNILEFSDGAVPLSLVISPPAERRPHQLESEVIAWTVLQMQRLDQRTSTQDQSR